MGLFPDANDNNEVNPLEVVGTPKRRRKLFVDILSVVAGGSTTATISSIQSSSSSVETCTSSTHTMVGEEKLYPGIEGGFIVNQSKASPSKANNNSKGLTVGRFSSSHSAQQLSTSWEFWR